MTPADCARAFAQAYPNMFVINSTSAEVVLKKGFVSDDCAVASMVFAVDYRVEGERLVPLPDKPEPVVTDPPDTSIHVVWEGTSVTAAGHAHGPPRAPFVQPVSFQVGSITRRLIVFGDRVWERAWGRLAPSAPARFDAIALGFDRAFGGGWEMPPGLVPHTNLPHPGGRMEHQLNPLGRGFYRDADHAASAPLPNIERPDQLMKNWNDAPEPAGFTPCRELVALRMREIVDAQLKDHLARGGSAHEMPRQLPSFRLIHHAPPGLYFDHLAPGTHVELTGLGHGTMRFAVPASPVTGAARGKSGEKPLSPRLRALHADADRRLVRAVFDFSFRYHPDRAPRRLRVRPATEETV